MTEDEVATLERRLRSINSLATIARTQRSKVDVEYVLGVGGYDLERVENEVGVLIPTALSYDVDRVENEVGLPHPCHPKLRSRACRKRGGSHHPCYPRRWRL